MLESELEKTVRHDQMQKVVHIALLYVRQVLVLYQITECRLSEIVDVLV